MPALRRWLWLSGLLVVLGPCCCTSPLGGAVSIFVWMRAGDEMARADAGVGAPTLGAAAKRVRGVAFALMTFSTFSLCAQAFLWPWTEPVLIDVLAWLVGLLEYAA